jgi:hypothetical protein
MVSTDTDQDTRWLLLELQSTASEVILAPADAELSLEESVDKAPIDYDEGPSQCALAEGYAITAQ